MSYEKIINLTPHDVNIYRAEDVFYSGETRSFVPFEGRKPFRVFAAADTAARCVLEESETKFIDGIQTYAVSASSIVGLPDAVPGIIYIVSSIVARFGALAGRNDLVIPHGIVKSESGMTIGCTTLAFMQSFLSDS